jgi:DNA invertase Pin-like site-specific DNA recombinase
MAKNVLFYARYSTERQNEVSIETQIDLGREFIDDKGWTLVDVFTDHAVSGTSYTTRPGIQALLARAGKRDIDVVLCVTVDRVSRDSEHGNGFLKRLRFQDIELWTVHGGTAVTDIEMSLRVTLSQELIEQIRYRTREGMKTAVRKGKATTCLAYGYKVRLEYDGNGDRIPGLRDIVPDHADTVRWIFQQYAEGVSPRDIAIALNKQCVPGPRGRSWRDTAIRGHVTRGTGILNNETYIGRVVWNRRQYRKNPDTERRVARPNTDDKWVVNEDANLRIVDDALWARVKARQAEVGDLFTHTKTNALNATHRPSYLLSGILECAECGGPYAISGKDRYSCTNHKKQIPIDDLDGACCQNQKTILRSDLESRVIACLPAAFLQLGIFDKVSADVLQRQQAKLKSTPSQSQQLTAELAKIEQQQASIIQQISDRAAEARPRLTALDDLLDRLELQRGTVSNELANTAHFEPDMSERLAELRRQINPEAVQKIMALLLYFVRDDVDTTTKQPFVDMTRKFIQKVVITKTAGHQPAELSVHGRIASILAAMEAATILEQRLKLQHEYDFQQRLRAGELDTDAKRKKLLSDYAEELDKKKLGWVNLQVSVVAGAGFEPAAFRL